MSRRDAHPKSRGESVQATTQRSYGLLSSRDATRTTVHDCGTPSRAEPDARCKQMLQLGIVLGDAHKRIRHGTAHDHAKNTVAGRSQGRNPLSRTRRHGREARHESFYTRHSAVMKNLFHAVEG